MMDVGVKKSQFSGNGRIAWSSPTSTITLAGNSTCCGMPTGDFKTRTTDSAPSSTSTSSGNIAARAGGVDEFKFSARPTHISLMCKGQGQPSVKRVKPPMGAFRTPEAQPVHRGWAEGTSSHPWAVAAAPRRTSSGRRRTTRSRRGFTREQVEVDGGAERKG